MKGIGMMNKCDVCFGLKIYLQETCVACKGTGEANKHHFPINERNVYAEMFENNYMHLVDDNDNLSIRQKDVMRVLLQSDSFFIPFSFDGNWDYVYTEGKVALAAGFLNGDWSFRLLHSSMEDNIYMLELQFNNPILLRDFVHENYNGDLRDEAPAIELYLAYHDFLKFYAGDMSKDYSIQFWRSVIREDDLLEIHKIKGEC